ncbi:MAG: aminomethyltransferase family protein, partial [Deltaproteobacteria bacterium]|nr:aminomethyltransferase family protein [Deltaproteobacteria bacterium]
YKIAEPEYMVVVNAGMGSIIAQHLEAHAEGRNVAIADLTDRLGKIDIQGPMAAKILKKVLKNPEKSLKDLPCFGFKGHFDKEASSSPNVQLMDDTPLLLSRSGYTGEFGFEVFIVPDQLVKAWEMIVNAGEEFGLLPCGLAARDSLRTGAMLPLSHQDIGPWPFINNPWSFALPYVANRTGFAKRFIGGEALMSSDTAEYTYAFTGFDPRKVTDSMQPQVLDSEGNHLGVVLTCVTDMAIGRHNGKIYSIASPHKPKNFKARGLSCGFVKVRSKLYTGQMVKLNDKRRTIKVVIVDDIRPHRTARRPMSEMM